MTAQPSSEQNRPPLGLQQEWFQPILLPVEAYGDFARRLNDQLAELETRFAVPKPISPRASAGGGEIWR